MLLTCTGLEGVVLATSEKSLLEISLQCNHRGPVFCVHQFKQKQDLVVVAPNPSIATAYADSHCCDQH